jgi:hypothetical protein
MFDQSVRTLAQAFAAANNWFWNFLVARFTPQMFNAMGFGVYFLFASLMLCSVVFVYFLMPETKGIPLEAMDRLFDRSLPARKAHKVVLAELRATDEEFRRNSTAHIEKFRRASTTYETVDVSKEKSGHMEDV